MWIIAHHNQKGGVGKSATAINVGAALAESGRRVLLVDLDPQGHLSAALGIGEGSAAAALPAALLGQWSGALRELIVEYRPRLHVIPTHIEMFLLEGQLFPLSGREWRLTRLLEAFAGAYDVVIIDCPPSLGPLTDNALVAVRRRRRSEDGQVAGAGIVIPVQAEDSTIKALEILYQQLDSLQAGLGIGVDTLGLLVNLYDPRRGVFSREMYSAIEDLGLPVLGRVNNRVTILQAWRSKLSVIEYDPRSEEAGWYREIAEKVTGRMAEVAVA